MPLQLKTPFFTLLAILSTPMQGQEAIDLTGVWQTKLAPPNKGIEEQWFKSPSFPEVLTLPGCIQEQGYGKIPKPKTTWWNRKIPVRWNTSRPWVKEYATTGNLKTLACYAINC